MLYNIFLTEKVPKIAKKMQKNEKKCKKICTYQKFVVILHRI